VASTGYTSRILYSTFWEPSPQRWRGIAAGRPVALAATGSLHS
jgi:hypothetical protein